MGKVRKGRVFVGFAVARDELRDRGDELLPLDLRRGGGGVVDEKDEGLLVRQTQLCL